MMFLKALLSQMRGHTVAEPVRQAPQPDTKKRILPSVTYNEDGLATVHNCDFLQDKRFVAAYALGKATGSWRDVDVRWRAYVVCWAAQQGLGVNGDFVECGVNRGGYARTIIAYTAFEQLARRFYLLDTFAGLVEKYISEEELRAGLRPGGYAECYETVQQTFAPFSNVVLVRGAVPETLSEVASEKIAFLSIDMNCVPPEIAAATHFWDRLSPGAVMVIDDYGAPGHIFQKQAFDRFAAERSVPILQLPTGQGLIVKPFA